MVHALPEDGVHIPVVSLTDAPRHVRGIVPRSAGVTATPGDGTGGGGGMEDRIQAEHSHRWIRAERIQAAYRKGWNVADEEQRPKDADRAASKARAAADRTREQALRDEFGLATVVSPGSGT